MPTLNWNPYSDNNWGAYGQRGAYDQIYAKTTQLQFGNRYTHEQNKIGLKP